MGTQDHLPWVSCQLGGQDRAAPLLQGSPTVGMWTTGTAKAEEALHSMPTTVPGETETQPRKYVHSPANGFFCVSTPQITMAKLEGNRQVSVCE